MNEIDNASTTPFLIKKNKTKTFNIKLNNKLILKNKFCFPKLLTIKIVPNAINIDA